MTSTPQDDVAGVAVELDRERSARWRRFADLVHDDRVHSRIFTDDEIFEAEIEQIFHRSWLYLAHESEIPEPGDYCLRWLGRHSVIVTRSADGEIHVLLNRCRHRGTTVCQYESGSSRFFRCNYHGWTYANDGRLVAVPYPEAYDETFSTDDFALGKPETETYRGLVFARLRPGGPSLLEHLGKAREQIDDFFLASPTEKLEILPDAHRMTYRGNWKYIGMDGYHVNFTHRSLLDLSGNGGALNTTSSPSLVRDFGNGNVQLDLSPSIGSGQAADIIRGSEAKKAGEKAYGEYVDSMRERHGDRAQEVILRGNDPHVHIWPNLQIIGIQLRVMRPIAPDLTEVTLYCARLDGVPDEVNEARIDAHIRFYGPGSFGQPDDSEMFERNQVGLMAERDPWVYLGRGLATERKNDDGSIVGNITDETTQRGQMRAWRTAMLAAGEQT